VAAVLTLLKHQNHIIAMPTLFLADLRSLIFVFASLCSSVFAFEKLHKLKTISLHLQGFTCLHRRLRSAAIRFVVAAFHVVAALGFSGCIV